MGYRTALSLHTRASGFCYQASLNLPDGQMRFKGGRGGDSNYRRTVTNAHQKFFGGLVEMTFGLVHASYSFPEWQAVELTFFAPCEEKWKLLRVGGSNDSHFHIIVIYLQVIHRSAIGQFFSLSPATVQQVAWENSWHLATLPLVSLPNGVWETTAQIPYWWRVTTQIWVVLLIGWIKFPTTRSIRSTTQIPSSVWNFCASFSDAIWWWNQW